MVAHRLSETARLLAQLVAHHARGQPGWPTSASAAAPTPSATSPSTPAAQVLAKNDSAPSPWSKLGYMVDGDQVQVLTSPAGFYEQLKTNIRNARRHIVLSALYIGPQEHDLIQTIHDSLAANPSTKCTILIDYLRGTRGASSNSVTVLAPLISAFPDRVNVALYHTPELTGWKKRLIPPRFNETVGLLHFKLFATDDQLIISGANLSHDYFTNRQDRYMHIADARVARHYARVVEAVADVSFRVRVPEQKNAEGGYELLAPTPYSPVDAPREYKRHAHARLAPALVVESGSGEVVEKVRDTLIVPAVQASPLGVYQEQDLMAGVWAGLKQAADAQREKSDWNVYFTSGYFNMTPLTMNTMLGLNRPVNVLTASPQANGFFGSKGVSKYIPDAYTWLESRFLARVRGTTQPIVLAEYARPGWTFHAKGLWISPVASRLPWLTVIGSSNFGHRSMHRDVEAQAIVVTTNKRLQEELRDEVDALWAPSKVVEEKELEARRVHWLTKVVAYATQNMF
ncbi:hypothetical protein AMAG_15248 [Allomyces macrogynus ATCC 38327]|uniref:CDP-diacylglycerol--glycerol-3-phosphate 3-phosphatidyltransferase n=1 Tax=Allomyces macrogynus (strain ATCC 38327) TaxID=578462 RepID=A0A0L0T8X9_ALLM3|nr:hypothetical protein AMAG_15248 [Allomyces macrogynus ATCC 38327]|eukprot:KNE70989.1 hypothetical protein AMAG_15248 [Allomyces macrogynus ATCC 38327]